MANLPEPVRTIALVGILAGLRIGEILDLSWENADFVAKTIRIEHAVYRDVLATPKTKGSRCTPPNASNASGGPPEPFQRLIESNLDWLSPHESANPIAIPTSSPVFLRPAGSKSGLLAQLAYTSPDSRNSALAVGGVPQGRPGPAGARTHLHHNGYLHSAHPSASTGGSKQAVSIGNEW